MHPSTKTAWVFLLPKLMMILMGCNLLVVLSLSRAGRLLVILIFNFPSTMFVPYLNARCGTLNNAVGSLYHFRVLSVLE
jgi:hypothetical protein